MIDFDGWPYAIVLITLTVQKEDSHPTSSKDRYRSYLFVFCFSDPFFADGRTMVADSMLRTVKRGIAELEGCDKMTQSRMMKEKPRRVRLREPDLKRLWALSAGRCNKPDCRVVLLVDPTEFDEAVVMGEQAHIAPHAKGGPRHISMLPERERDRYQNIILLCPNHHRGPVDGQPNTYTEELLHKWKNDHEAWVRDTLTQAIPRLQFDELQAVAERLAEVEPVQSTPLAAVNIPDKMKVNDLTAETKSALIMAVAGAKEAQRYINYTEPNHPQFGRKLRSSFMAQYHQGVLSGLEGNDLFWHLYRFAVGPSMDDPKTMAPGIAILGYLFTTCEIFDVP